MYTTVCHIHAAHNDTDFKQKFIIVEEDVGVLTDTLCVIGGPEKRSFGLFSARGMSERCSRGPCPGATGACVWVRVCVCVCVHACVSLDKCIMQCSDLWTGS